MDPVELWLPLFYLLAYLKISLHLKCKCEGLDSFALLPCTHLFCEPRNSMLLNSTAFPSPDGTATSIASWSRLLELDASQMQLFQLVLANFILCSSDSTTSVNAGTSWESKRSDLLKERTNLKRLISIMLPDKTSTPCSSAISPRRVFLVHCQQGSAHHKILRGVVHYLKGYIAHKLLDSNIIVTAMSRKTALNLNCKTTHCVYRLNCRQQHHAKETYKMLKKPLLVCIDDIHLASVDDMATIDYRLRACTRRTKSTFGGIFVVFFGDVHKLANPSGPMEKSLASLKSDIFLYTE